LHKLVETDHEKIVFLAVELDFLTLLVVLKTLQPGIDEFSEIRILLVVLIEFVFEKFTVKYAADGLKKMLIEACGVVDLQV
jgi:hypothetical protein